MKLNLTLTNLQFHNLIQHVRDEAIHAYENDNKDEGAEWEEVETEMVNQFRAHEEKQQQST